MAVIDLNDFNTLDIALTKGCVQYGWGAHYHFPCCPEKMGIHTLESYFQNFKVGAVFAYNDDSPKLIVLEFVRIKNGSSILVMCEREGLTSEREGFQPWFIAEIRFENGLFVHNKLSSHFEKEDAHLEFLSYKGAVGWSF